MIEERDSLLHESTRRFNLLKEDFQYNLTLLEARDKEIARLHYVEVQLEAVTQDKENLSKRMEMMMMKECEKEEKIQQDKITNKVVCLFDHLIHIFPHSLPHSLPPSLTHSLTHSFTHLIHSFTHLIHSLYTHARLYFHLFHAPIPSYFIAVTCMHTHALIHINTYFC